MPLHTPTITPDDLNKIPFDAIIDTRSPSEFAEDHLPGAINCPVLSDEERIKIGTLYKHASPFDARKEGAILTARNIADAIEKHFLIRPKNWRPLVYCWRGGQRSGAMQIILRQIGWDAIKLQGGYKAWRRHVMQGLETIPSSFRYIVIAGPTGSGKTKLIEALSHIGVQTLNLENLADHKGSVLGLPPGKIQRTRKNFDSLLFTAFESFDPQKPVFIEDESKRIGDIHLPQSLIVEIAKSPVIHLNPALDARVNFLLEDYDYFLNTPDVLRSRLEVLRPLHPQERIEKWMVMIERQQWHDLVHSLLEHHYDPLYDRSLKKRAYTREIRKNYILNSLSSSTIKGLAEKIVTDLPLLFS